MRGAASAPQAGSGCESRPPLATLMDSNLFCYRADVRKRGGIVKADLQNTWRYLGAIVIAGWFQACSKSDAATISEDESSIHHHRRTFHHHDHDHDEDNDWND